MGVVSPRNRPRNVLRMNPHMHADAGRFRRGWAKGDQAAQKREAGRGRKRLSLLHDFVLVPVGVTIPETGSTDPLGSRKARTAIFGIEPVPMALSSRTSPFHPAASPTKC
jgi:hypothetical protein